MSRYCPYVDHDVVYLECGECEKKICGKEWFFCLVIGSRSFADYGLLDQKLSGILRNHPDTVIVSSRARGADALAERYAEKHGLPYIGFPADWKKYGKSAGFIRNKQMHAFIATQPKRGVVAFWDGRSKETAQGFALAEEFGNEMRIVRF